MSKYTNQDNQFELDEIDDIEILDFNNDIEILEVTKEEKIEPKIEEKKETKKEKKNKKTNKTIKAPIIQNIFIIISIVFIIACCIFYGYRLIKYYKIYNPKSETGEKLILLNTKIKDRVIEIDGKTPGLYNSNGYIFRGDVDNNYLKYNNMLWRITKINYDGSIEIMLNEYLNYLSWNKEIESFEKSDIYDYLNNELLNKLDKNLLQKQKICLDEINDLSKFTCTNSQEDYISLMNTNSFLTSQIDSKTYIANEDEEIWLSTKTKDGIYSTNGSKISKQLSNTFLEIKPVVLLANNIVYTKGDGTKENPYIVESKEKLTFSTVVSLDNDLYYVYETNDDKLTLLSVDVLKEKKIYDKKSSIFNKDNDLYQYLNNEYLDNLSYKNKIIENEYAIGKYEKSYKTVNNEKIKAKIAIPSLKDIKINNKITNYNLTTYTEDGYILNDNLLKSRIYDEKNIRIMITIDKNTKITGGEGTIESPYIMEV